MRPLLLVQAQNTNAEANVQAVKEHLLEEGVDESAIKIATGEQRELDNLDLMSRETKVDAVITMEALREGWDCSFAYVFCSLRNVTTDTAAEQLLGRVLRMPYASRRRVPELNEAYAYVISNNFAETAQGLKDRLVRDLGSTAEESGQFVCPVPEHGPGLFAKVIDVTRRPNFVGIAPEATRSVRLLQSPDGAWSVELRETVSPEVESRIVAEVPVDAQGQARARIAEHNRVVATEHASLPERQPIAVPQLYVSVGGEPMLFTWDLAGEEAPLLPSDLPVQIAGFNYSPSDRRFAIDFQLGRMDVRPLQRAELPFYKTEWQPTHQILVRWLSREIRTVSMSRAQLDAWLTAWLLQITKEVPLATLWSSRFAVARRLSEVLLDAQSSAHLRGYDQLLLEAFVPLGDEGAFHFVPDRYYPSKLHHGFNFNRHFYRVVGEMNGPEIDCATVLDSMPGIDTWVRNVDADQEHSFKLPKRVHFFYPDFVARLHDSRLLVAEYKGAMQVAADANEKKRLGELWQSRTNGRGIFAWIESPRDTGKSIELQLSESISSS